MIKKYLSFRTKYRALLFLQSFKPLSYFKTAVLTSEKRRAFIFLAADYGNLGDVAITYAQTKFIKDNSNFEVIEIPISKSIEGLHFVKSNIKPGDIVTTVGGGNLGDMYDQIEFIRQLVVEYFPHNRVISFPQTFDFADTAYGKERLLRAKKAYSKHHDLYFVAREEVSYKLMKEHFTNAKIILTPDIVISLNKRDPKQVRSGAVICMRNDQEKNMSEEMALTLKEKLKEHFTDIKYYDTHIDRTELSVPERENELDKIWSAFRSAELVITDRLHGMIFCYITNTPCLVFQNSNHKVRGTYEWIKHDPNINFISDHSEEVITQRLQQRRHFDTALPDILPAYQPLLDLIQ